MKNDKTYEVRRRLCWIQEFILSMAKETNEMISAIDLEMKETYEIYRSNLFEDFEHLKIDMNKFTDTELYDTIFKEDV